MFQPKSILLKAFWGCSMGATLGQHWPFSGLCWAGPLFGHLMGFMGFHESLWGENETPTENFSVGVHMLGQG